MVQTPNTTDDELEASQQKKEENGKKETMILLHIKKREKNPLQEFRSQLNLLFVLLLFQSETNKQTKGGRHHFHSRRKKKQQPLSLYFYTFSARKNTIMVTSNSFHHPSISKNDLRHRRPLQQQQQQNDQEKSEESQSKNTSSNVSVLTNYISNNKQKEEEKTLPSSPSSSPPPSSSPSSSLSSTDLTESPTLLKPTLRPQRRRATANCSMSYKETKQIFHQYFKQLHKYFKEEPFIRTRFLLGLFFICLSKLIGCTIPIFFKKILLKLQTIQPQPSSFSTTPPSSPTTAFSVVSIVLLVLLYSFACMLQTITQHLTSVILSHAKQKINRHLSCHSLKLIHRLGYSWYTSKSSSGIGRIVHNGTRAFLDITRILLFGITPSICQIIFLICYMIQKRWIQSIFILLFMTMCFIYWTLKMNRKCWSSLSKRYDWQNESYSKLNDSLINYEIVCMFNNDQLEMKRFDYCLNKVEVVTGQMNLHMALLYIGQKFIFIIGFSFILLSMILTIHVVHYHNDSFIVGDIVSFTVILQQFWSPLLDLGWQFRNGKDAMICLQLFFDLLETKPSVVNVKNAKDLIVTGGEIIFDHVSFSFPDQHRQQQQQHHHHPHHHLSKSNESSDTTNSTTTIITNNHDHNHHHHIQENDDSNKRDNHIVKDLSFHVRPGQKVAIVGETGSGKSTILRLLYRLYDIDKGRILIDGQDISKVTLSSLRQAIAIIPQDTALFNDTIAYNIGYGHTGASMKQVIQVAKAANIHNTILQMKDGYNTISGEKGVRFSGGEKQRVSCARAFLKNSKIVLLDEATSSLDSKTEAQVCKSLTKLGQNRTSLVVAHRLSTIFDADWIIVMNKGAIVEQGTHKSLLEIENGTYKSMWELRRDVHDEKNRKSR